MEGMPRSNRPRRQAAGGRSAARGKRAAGGANDAGSGLERARFGIDELQEAPDGAWHVRRISPTNAAKTYTCPGCRHQIAPGVEHVVAWRADAWFGEDRAAAERRHWHAHCWRTRNHRYL
jgi:hypothetical protein